MENSLLLGQVDEIIGWLTPVWLISVGIAVGLILAHALRGLFYLLSRIPGLNTLNESPGTKIVGASVFGVLFLGCILAYGFLFGEMGRLSGAREITLVVLIGLLAAILFGYGMTAIVSLKRFEELRHQPKGNFGSWFAKICLAMGIFALSGVALALSGGFGAITIVENPTEMMQSLLRLPNTGNSEISVKVPAKSTTAVDVSFYGSELRFIGFRSDQPVDFATEPVEGKRLTEYFEVASNNFVDYRRQAGDARIPDGEVTQLHFRNQGDFDADVDVRWNTAVAVPQVAIIPRIAIAVLIIFVAYWMFCAACPKIAAISSSTFKTEVSQPVFILLAIVASVFIVGSIYLPYNTFGEDIKMYKMSALTLIRIIGIFMAIWAASKSVAEEIEGRTALTVLSKPVGRRQFILGKFSGISLAIGLMFLIVGLWFIIWVCYKPIYDAREASTRDFAWVNGFSEAVRTVPGLVLAYLESLVFVAISIAISTRLGILANFMVCFAVYVLGHLTPMIVQSAEVVGAFEPVLVFGQFISVVFPVLDHFDVEPAIIGDVDVPLSYLGWSSIYCLIYGAIALLLSLVLFEDRDLA